MHNEEKRLQDISDVGEVKIAAMLGALERVEAPGDFDLRVRARIARGRPTEGRASWIPTLARIGAPAALLLFVAAYFGYSSLYRNIQVNVPDVAGVENVVPKAPLPDPTVAEVVVSAPEEPAPRSAAEKPEVRSPEVASVAKKPKKSVNSNADSGGGSFDSALGVANAPITPKKVAPPSNMGVPPGELSVKEVLGRIGVSGASTGSGWRVESVSGRASRAGVEVGDVIEAVNGIPIGVNVMFTKNFAGSSLRVRRDGSVIQISLN
ncbi:MAG: hypothetical protein AB7J13_09230 [Pyrinomonadaceae bacterium]